MTTSDWIAIYAAVLSTLLVIKEIIAFFIDLAKERQGLKIFLEHVAWHEIPQLTIVNVSQRPITIIEIGMGVWGGDTWMGVSPGVVFAGEEETPKFPKMLMVGESVTYKLGEMLRDEVADTIYGKKRVKVSVVDAEGREYSRFDLRVYNAKLGTIETIGKNKLRRLFMSLWFSIKFRLNIP